MMISLMVLVLCTNMASLMYPLVMVTGWAALLHTKLKTNTITAAMVEVKGKLNKHVTLGGMYGRFHNGKLYQGQDVGCTYW